MRVLGTTFTLSASLGMALAVVPQAVRSETDMAIQVDSLAVPTHRVDAKAPDKAWRVCPNVASVLVRVTVGPEGKVREAMIDKRGILPCLDSSAMATLDRVALATARKWKWAPSQARPQDASYLIGVIYRDWPDSAARGRIEGRVLDETTGSGIQYASITVLGSRVGAMTDREGRFAINAPPGRSWIQASSVAYQQGKQWIHIHPGRRQEIDFRLKPRRKPE